MQYFVNYLRFRDKGIYMPPRAQSKTANFKKAAKKSLPLVSQQTLDALMNLTLGPPSAPLPAKKTAKKPLKPTGEGLLKAAYNNDTELVRQLAEAGADVNFQEPNGWTALQHAADQNNIDIARILLDRGADMNHRNIPTGRAAIHYAAEGEDTALLDLLIERGAQIDIRNNEGETPLFDAASSGSEDCVKLLIDSGCDVTAKNFAGKSAVYAAAKGSQAEIAELLMTYPAESSARRATLEARQKASGEALAATQTVLQERVSVSRPLVLKSPLK